jgi:hypothetical protein
MAKQVLSQRDLNTISNLRSSSGFVASWRYLHSRTESGVEKDSLNTDDVGGALQQQRAD